MFLKYRKSIYSQWGEEGILEKIVKDLELKNLEVCEFGASDGQTNSNTFYFAENFNAKTLLIESNQEYGNKLNKLSKKFSNILFINKAVDLNENKLDNFLTENKFKRDFDILSIDIDSNDLEIWESIKYFKPKIVVIEISKIKPGISTRYIKNIQGNSFSAAIEVGRKLGYTAVAHTGNLIFLDNLYLDRFQYPQDLVKNPEKIFNEDFYKRTVRKNYLYKMINITVKILRKIFPKVLRDLVSPKLKTKISRYF